MSDLLSPFHPSRGAQLAVIVVEEHGVDDISLVEDVVGEKLGRLNGYYVHYCLQHNVCQGVKVVVDGRAAGFTFHAIPPHVDIGVPSCIHSLLHCLAVL